MFCHNFALENDEKYKHPITECICGYAKEKRRDWRYAKKSDNKCADE